MKKLLIMTIYFVLISSVTLFSQKTVIHPTLFSSGFGSVASGDSKAQMIIGLNAQGVTGSIQSEADVGFLYKEESPTDIESAELNNDFFVGQNIPNPAYGKTEIEIFIQKATDVSIEIYNILGKKIFSEVIYNQHSGRFRYYFDVSTIATGSYFYKVSVNGSYKIRIMIIQK